MVMALRITNRCSSGAANGAGNSHSQIAIDRGELPLGPYPGGGLNKPLTAGEQRALADST